MIGEKGSMKRMTSSGTLFYNSSLLAGDVDIIDTDKTMDNINSEL